MQRVTIVSVGNELLFGETVDTNAAWLGRVLTGWGLEVVEGFTVRDRVDEIQRAVRRALEAADAVIVTGGLGPTADDVTKQAVAELLGVPLMVDQEVQAAVQSHFRSAGFEAVPERSHGQSEVPQGATALSNERGTAPGLLLEWEGRTLVLLPGVPRELEGIVEGPLREAWDARLTRLHRARHRVIRTTGIEEPDLAALIEERWADVPSEARSAIDLAYLPDELGVDLRFTVRGRKSAEAEALLAAAAAAIDPLVEPWSYEADSGDLAETVAHGLRRRGVLLAAAESCTGGLFGARMTQCPGSSDVFLGGIVSYDNAVKVAQLGVRREDLEHEGAVSETVARQMAAGVTARLGAGAGVAITGIAGPGGGSEEKPVGTVWIAVSLDGVVDARRHRFAGDRGAVRRRSVQAALAHLHGRLRGTLPRAGPA